MTYKCLITFRLWYRTLSQSNFQKHHLIWLHWNNCAQSKYERMNIFHVQIVCSNGIWHWVVGHHLNINNITCYQKCLYSIVTVHYALIYLLNEQKTVYIIFYCYFQFLFNWPSYSHDDSNINILLIVNRLHRSTTYVDEAYSHRPSSVISRSVWLWLSVCHSSEPCKMAEPIEMKFQFRTRVGPRNHVLSVHRGPYPHMGSGNFEGGKGHPTVKHRDTMQSSVQKRLNRSRCRLGCGLRWAQGIMC